MEKIKPSLKLKSDPRVKEVFNRYPSHVRGKIEKLRELIIETAGETRGIKRLEETLKWGEPSYLAEKGSTIRIDWKEKSPEQYSIYFKCTSKLVPTFKLVYGGLFNFEGNRAISFRLDEPVPDQELKQCIAAALTYHRVKNLPRLGL